MTRMLAMLLCCFLVAACGATSQYKRYASWDSMYYFDPYESSESSDSAEE